MPTKRLRELEHVFHLHSLPVDLARALEPRHVASCRVFAGRERILEWLPANGVCAEVGVQRGYFSEEILSRASPARLHLIDIDLSQIDHEHAPHIAPAVDQGVVQMHEAKSAEALRSFPSGYFDWIYIDGDHTYEGVSADIDQAVRVVKPDGHIVFNDYTNFSPLERAPYGVMRAVNELCLDQGYEIVALALQGLGYHDVALRRINDQRRIG